MAELTGIEAVKAYIMSADRCCFEIYRKNDNSNQAAFKYKGSQSKDASEKFEEWGATFSNNGMNFEPYRIVISNGIDETNPDISENSKKINKRHSSLSTTFVLNAMPGSMGKPTRNEQGDVVYYIPPAQPTQQQQYNNAVDLTKYVAKSEMETAIAHAVLNAELNNRIRAVEDRNRELEAENLMLWNDLRELEDDEEDEDDEEELHGEKNKSIMEIWSPDKIKDLVGNIKGSVVEVMSAANNPKGPTGGYTPQRLNAVAGEPATAGKIVIPKDAVPGTYPAFVDPTPENQELIYQDQQIKLQKIIRLLFKIDCHLGDDLIRLFYMSQHKVKTFNNAIDSLREEVIPQDFFNEVLK